MTSGVDFFVSYTTADRPWAEWIAWELEQAGFTAYLQAWDILPGANFPLAMHDAARIAQRTIAVLSPAFLASRYCAPEWAVAFCADATGAQRKLVPVRVRDCDPHGLLGPVVYVDMVGLSEAASRAALLDGVTDGRAKPADTPEFPGTAEGGGAQRVRRPEAGAAIFNVPVTTRTFVGRQQQLRRLAQGLADDGAVAITQVHAIRGIGGVGKTQLAARYAREQRDAYDVIWWLRAAQPQTLRADLAGLAAAVGLANPEADEHDAIIAMRQWLERNGRWLVVFDNARSPHTIAAVVPEGRAGHILITSRTHADWRALHAQPLALDVWERAESCEFLRKRTAEQDVRVVDAVAEALSDLPLALEQAAAYTNTKAITLADYAAELRERAPELFSAGRPATYAHTVTTVWQLAFEQIARQSLPDDLLGVCARMAPERIPRELLDAAAHSDGYDVSHTAVDEVIELLLDYALLNPGTEQTFGMHRCIGQLTGIDAEPAAQALAEAGRGRMARARVRFNLPAVVAAFTGREGELDALDDALGITDRAVITQALTGLGGVGKSQLAARYVQQRVERYDVVAWIRAEDGGVADLAALASNLGEIVEGLSLSEAAQLALDWLSDSSQRWLLALDNVESPEQLQRLLPRTGSGRVLVTSRDRALREFGPLLTVDVFNEDTATAYLVDRAERLEDECAARKLASVVSRK